MKIYTDQKRCNSEALPSLNPVLAFHWQGFSEQEREQGKNNSESPFILVNDPADADACILPKEWNYYLWHKKQSEAISLGKEAGRYGKKILIWFRGDLTPVMPVPNAIVFQSAMYRSKKKAYQFAAPYFVGDPTLKYSEGKIVLRQKLDRPVIGFCGYAGVRISKIGYGMLASVHQNLSSLLGHSNYESSPIVPATVLRARALKHLSSSNRVRANFIIRDKYRAGIRKKQEGREVVASEFFDNIYHSDYTVCIRGYGNWSIRFYETLACGRIPIFIDTDCILPFESSIDWKKYCVWVERKELPYIAEKVADFHSQITANEFVDLQLSCRKVWKERLSIQGFMSHIAEHFRPIPVLERNEL